MAWRFSSPHLQKEDQVLYECPTGLILRETPYVYEAIGASYAVESGGIDPMQQTPWLQAAMRVANAERSRLRETHRERERSKRDAAYGASVLKGGHG